MAQAVQVQSGPASTGAGEGARGASNPFPTQTEPAQPVRSKRPAHYLWAVLITRIYQGVSFVVSAAQPAPDFEVDQRVSW